MRIDQLKVQRLSCDKITLLASAPAFSGPSGQERAAEVARYWQPFASTSLASPHYSHGRSVSGVAVNWGKDSKLHQRVLINEYCDIASKTLVKKFDDIHKPTKYNIRIEFNPNKSSLTLIKDFLWAAFPESVSMNNPIKISRFDSAMDYHDIIDPRFIDSKKLRSGSIYFTGVNPETLYLGSSGAGSQLLRVYNKLREQIARRNQWISGAVSVETIADRYNHLEPGKSPFYTADDAAEYVIDPGDVDGLAGIDHWWRVEMQDRRECLLKDFKTFYRDTFEDVYALELPSDDLDKISGFFRTGKKSDSDLAFFLFAAQNPGRHHVRFLLNFLTDDRRRTVMKLLNNFHNNSFIHDYYTNNCKQMYEDVDRFIAPLTKHFHPLALMGLAREIPYD